MVSRSRRVALLDRRGEGGKRAGMMGEGRMHTLECWRRGERRMDT